jgi:hypothetical protein
MKRTLIASLLISTALLGFPGCASDKGQKPEPEKKPEQAKDNRPMD